jgi:hypothetical protein
MPEATPVLSQHLRNALQLLDLLPESPLRDEHELQLLIAARAGSHHYQVNRGARDSSRL